MLAADYSDGIANGIKRDIQNSIKRSVHGGFTCVMLFFNQLQKRIWTTEEKQFKQWLGNDEDYKIINYESPIPPGHYLTIIDWTVVPKEIIEETKEEPKEEPKEMILKEDNF